MYLYHPLMLLLPHLIQFHQTLIVPLLPLKRIQRLHQYLLNTRIPSHPKQLLNSIHKLRIYIPRKCLPWIVRQYPNQHNRIILNIRLVEVVLREELPNYQRGFFCGARGGFGGFDDRGQVEDFFAAALGASGFAE